MTLEEFLLSNHVDLSALATAADSSIGVHPGDSLFIVGSLVEGLGNSKSDLDLYLLTPRARDLLPSNDEITLIVGRCVVDVRILQSVAVEEMLARLHDWARLPWDATHASKFTKEERVLFHRLLHGQPLLCNGKIGIRPSLSEKALARLNLHVARHISRTIQVDMAGYRDSGDYRSLVFAAQELLGHAVDALLAGYGLTNPLPKWRSRLLESIPSDWESALTIRPTGMPAAERVWRLHRAPENPEPEFSVQHALRITAFARAVFLWTERLLVHETKVLHQRPAWPQLQFCRENAILPCLDFDVDFHLDEEDEGNVTFGRLNDFGETLILSACESSLCLLFDGVTTAAEAKAVLCSCNGKNAHQVDELTVKITEANLNA